jgi:preprotein translocase subunit SecA
MITQLIASLFGTANDRILRRLAPVVQRINSLEPSIQALDNDGLRQKTDQLREQIAQGKSLDDVLPEAFAVVREASARALGQRHFDVQLIGGIALHEGNIAEMKTGEGKTLTATLPLYLNALSGKSAHLVTVNDYLARRDAEWMSPIYTSLGLSVGCLQNNMNDNARQEAYNSDILYATNNELGFDYLRDNMKFRKEDYVQRDLVYAIVDEVDSILIDEARTPLIISGAVEDSSRLYIDANRVVARLEKNVDYTVDEKDRLALLTESGTDKVETAFNIANLYAVEHLTLLHHINQALRAHALFRRDVEYVVKDGEVLIVDEFTGRILSGRRYSDGLHQALEAKENVTIEEESQTLASITLQNFFRLYTKLAGMTGTASTEAEEFHNIYGLNVISIPTNQPMIRIDRSDLIFLTEHAKFKAIVQDVGERHKKGQPILIGTIAIETSERLSALLHHHDIPHDVLNAKQHEREAEIVAHAGEPGHVTIATNMAGRGTDIKLTPDSVRAGGLYILGTERHESRRIDNQLRGRSGRQGDPGESRFYISLEDELIRIFAGDTLKKYMERFGMKEDEIIESSMVSRTIERAQEKREKYNYEIRKHLLEYDDVLNQQRIVIYQYRRDALEGDDSVYSLIRDFFCSIIEEIVARHVQKRTMTAAQQSAIIREIAAMLGITIENMADFDAILSKNKSESFVKDLINFFLTYYELFRNQQNLTTIRQAEKWLVLNTIDQSWKQHMLNLDHLKEGIGLRGWGQKNPLIEYKREAFDMFKEMMMQIQQHIISHIFRINVDRFDAHRIEQERERELENINLIAAQDPLDVTPKSEPARLENKIGRNDPCPCGSGKKYKKCCGQT